MKFSPGYAIGVQFFLYIYRNSSKFSIEDGVNGHGIPTFIISYHVLSHFFRKKRPYVTKMGETFTTVGNESTKCISIVSVVFCFLFACISVVSRSCRVMNQPKCRETELSKFLFFLKKKNYEAFKFEEIVNLSPTFCFALFHTVLNPLVL